MLPQRPSPLALWLSFVVLLGPTLCDDQENEVLTQQVFSALNRVLDFYRRDFKSINLDGIFGLRVAQGKKCIQNNSFVFRAETRDNLLNTNVIFYFIF